jgi:glucan phosphoethanolaminetransferase (alkaline phosphatase superfamily)
MNEHYIQPNADMVYFWGISINLLDTPLMLLFLSYFSTSAAFSRRLVILILTFLVFELSVVLLYGFNVRAITIVLGPGILIVFALCLFIFIRHSKVVITNRKALGKTLIAASLVFAYGCYGILYVLFYVIKTPQVADTFLLYFIVLTLSSLILCAGVIFERKRIQKLFELKKARKELHDIYKDTRPASSFRTAMLDFDSEPWN